MSKKFEGIYYTIHCFVGEHKLEKEADELWGEGWEPDGDNEMIAALIEHIKGENYYYVHVMDDDHYEITYNHDEEKLDKVKKKLKKTKKALKVALLQLEKKSEGEVESKAPKVKLEMTKKSTIHLCYSNFENFVNSIYGGNYEMQPDLCCANDTTHEFSVPYKYGDEEELSEVRKGKYPEYCTSVIFQALYEDGHIEEGEYIVSVSY
jgi:hypothetical protein